MTENTGVELIGVDFPNRRVLAVADGKSFLLGIETAWRPRMLFQVEKDAFTGPHSPFLHPEPDFKRQFSSIEELTKTVRAGLPGRHKCTDRSGTDNSRVR